MDIDVKQKGNYNKVTEYLNKLKDLRARSIIEKYAEKGLEALKEATPVRTGLTASSWNYVIEGGEGRYKLIFNNTNVNGYVNLALILDEGHGTGTGGWVEGLDYINPALQPIITELIERIRVEVSVI